MNKLSVAILVFISLCFLTHIDASQVQAQCPDHCFYCCASKFPVNPCAPKFIQKRQHRRQAFCRGRCNAGRLSVCSYSPCFGGCANSPVSTCCPGEDKNKCYTCCYTYYSNLPGALEWCLTACDRPDLQHAVCEGGGPSPFNRCRCRGRCR